MPRHVHAARQLQAAIERAGHAAIGVILNDDQARIARRQLAQCGAGRVGRGIVVVRLATRDIANAVPFVDGFGIIDILKPGRPGKLDDVAIDANQSPWRPEIWLTPERTAKTKFTTLHREEWAYSTCSGLLF
jgi:hypothetical protein